MTMPFTQAELEKKLTELIEAHNIPGAQLTVLDGDTMTEVAAGVLSLRTGCPATTDALFLPGSIGKLYTVSFYRELARAMAPGAVASVQSTSPLVAPKAYWTVARTLEAAGLTTKGYHVYVPSFGEWGFVMASNRPIGPAGPLPAGLRFLNPRTDALAFAFPPDMARRPVPVNRLDNQALVREFEAEWAVYEG